MFAVKIKTHELCWCSFDKISWKNLNFSVDSFADDTVGFINEFIYQKHMNIRVRVVASKFSVPGGF